MASKKISKQEVERIAKLSRLGLTKKEILQATQDIGGILDHFSKIQKIDTSNTPTADDVTGLTNIMREDKAKKEVLCKSDTLINNVPESHQGQIKVKAVFE